jgi:hypothetical protein
MRTECRLFGLPANARPASERAASLLAQPLILQCHFVSFAIPSEH